MKKKLNRKSFFIKILLFLFLVILLVFCSLLRQKFKDNKRVKMNVLRQTELFRQAVSFRYIDTKEMNELIYFKGKRIVLASFMVDFNGRTAGIMPGEYKVCLTQTPESTYCHVEVYLVLHNSSPYLNLTSDFISNIPYLGPELDKAFKFVENGFLLGLPGVSDQSENNLGYLKFIYISRNRYYNTTFYTIPLKAFLQPTYFAN